MEAEKTETNQGFVTKYDMVDGWEDGYVGGRIGT